MTKFFEVYDLRWVGEIGYGWPLGTELGMIKRIAILALVSLDLCFQCIVTVKFPI